MGQYYHATIEDEHGRTAYYNNVCGVKLMEHSWMKNNFMGFICKRLYNKPHKVAWVGDYAEESMSPNIETKEYWKYDGQEVQTSVKEICKEEEIDISDKYLINHTYKIYVNMKNYCKNNNDKGWIIHPLSLLTAISNGQGGGDYYGTNMDVVGTWAWNNIEIKDNPPKDYTEVEYEFKE